MIKNGKPVAVLLTMEDQDELEGLILDYAPQFQRILRVAEKQIRDGYSIPHEELWKEMRARLPQIHTTGPLRSGQPAS